MIFNCTTIAIVLYSWLHISVGYVSSESLCDLILEMQLSYHIWYRRAPFLRDTDVANGAKRDLMEIIFMK